VPGPISHVTGFQVKNKEWSGYDNEDHSEYSITFKDGALATLFMSNLSMIERPRWTIRGDKGSIVSEDNAQRYLVKRVGEDGREWSTTISYANQKGNWHAYYQNVCAH